MKQNLKVLFFAVIMIFAFITIVNAEELENNIVVDQNEEQVNDNIMLENKEINNVEKNEEVNNIDSNLLENEETVENEFEKIQLVKVITSKVSEEGQLLVGAKLQILDIYNNVLDEWISDGTKHETLLKDGEYILREVEAPEGYELAQDVQFEVNAEVFDINADVDWQEWPCNHGDGTPLYYVEVNSVSYEVYCMNQGYEAPDGIKYNGEIIKSEEIRNYTVQKITVSGDEYFGDGKYGKAFYKTAVEKTVDVSDQTLDSQELYDKILDIVYHRHNVYNVEKFKGLKEAEIRFITEYALKNYLNAGITSNLESARDENDTNIRFEAEDGKKYLLFEYKYYNREYVYDPTAPKGYRVDRGNGDALGNLARHWYSKHGKVQLPKIYADLFYYLISDETNHPDDMNLYVYSTNLQKDGTPYQNLLSITGYIDDLEQEQEIQMINNFSKEKTSVKVNKIWKDNNNQDAKRPSKVEVTLYADGKKIGSTILNENNNWEYSFNELPMYNKDKKIEYTISEKKVDHYKTIINGFTIINFYETEKRNISIEKIWDDKDDCNKVRPKSVTVNLYANNILYKSIELNKNNDWKLEIENLDVYKNGKIIDYTIKENTVIGYYTEIEGDMNSGFKVINTYFEDDDEPNPKTYDNINTYIIINIISICLLIISVYLYKKCAQEDV